MDVWVAWNEFRRISFEVQSFPRYFHLDAPQVHQSVALIKLCENKRINAHKSHRKLEIVLFRIEWFWILFVHIFEHSIDDKLRLFVANELCEADDRVAADYQNNEQAKYGSKLSLVGGPALKIHINLASKQIKLREKVAESVTLRVC